jgi:hypothetical protein
MSTADLLKLFRSSAPFSQEGSVQTKRKTHKGRVKEKDIPSMLCMLPLMLLLCKMYVRILLKIQ